MRQKEVFRLLLLIGIFISATGSSLGQSWSPDHQIATIDGVYSFSYNQTPSQLVEILPAANPNTGLNYQWESSALPTSGFTAISGATASSYSIQAPLSQTTYYRRKSYSGSNFIYSNILKISVVSVNWEDINYIREHDVLTTGITTWTAIDQLAIGSKLQTTTYLDGLGRSVEKVSRETATPPSNPNSLWGDMVQFSVYDGYGREPVKNLPYTTTTQSGKFKTTQTTEQPQYYSTNYGESSPYSTITFDNSLFNRVKNVKSPGISWAAGAGNSADYDVNADADNVKVFSVNYVQGNAPILGTGPFFNNTTYPEKTLYKLTYTDENGKKVIEFINKAGQLILKKVELNDTHTDAYDGWICTYNVYDDFGLLRFQIQPEGVKYLANNSWSFAGTNGQTVLAEQVFQYDYDDKGRTVWKKAPGAAPLRMLYDYRDRVVFMQDGNQASMTTPQWTTNIYDELDRVVIVTLYNTTKTVSALQTDINNAATSSSITVTNPNQAIVDLVVNNRQPVTPRYAATNSIEFVSEGGNDFESLPSDEFVAEIDPTATAPGYSIASTTNKNPISSADLNNPAVTNVLKYMFYDSYSFSGVKSFNNTFTNSTAYDNSDPNVMVIASTAAKIGSHLGTVVNAANTAIHPKISLNPNMTTEMPGYPPFQMWSPNDNLKPPQKAEEFLEDPNCYYIDHPELLEKYPWYWGLEKLSYVLPAEKVVAYGGKGIVWVGGKAVTWVSRIKKLRQVSKLLEIGSEVFAKYERHIFSADHIAKGIMDLGPTKETIINSIKTVIKDNSGAVREGQNFILTKMNGHDATIKFFVEKGKVISVDAHKGFAERLYGNIIRK